jgi:hypothetical protein
VGGDDVITLPVASTEAGRASRSEICLIIRDFRARYGVSPTYREILADNSVHIVSLHTLNRHIQNLLLMEVLETARIPGIKPTSPRTLLPGPRFDEYLADPI